MRGQIIDAIYDRMGVDQSVFFLTADMGINLVERFEESYPDRFCNVGIAEQNLVGVSSGLVNAGFRPFAYTISNFMVHRCFEQVRNDIGIHQYPVTIMGTSTGFDNAPLGPTHHVIDDWGPLRSIPGVDIYCPSSVSYAESLIDRVLETGRPAYIRIPKGGFETPNSTEDMILVEGGGQGILLASYGSVVQNCLAAMDGNPELSTLIFNRLTPFDEPALCNILDRYEHVVVVEDHMPLTGLYGSLCELKSRHDLKLKLSYRAPEGYTLTVGTSPDFYHRMYEIDSESLKSLIT